MDRTVVENAIVTWTVPVVENAIVTWTVPVVENATVTRTVPVVENDTVTRTVLIVELLYSESNPKGAVFSQPVRFVRCGEYIMACSVVCMRSASVHKLGCVEV